MIQPRKKVGNPTFTWVEDMVYVRELKQKRRRPKANNREEWGYVEMAANAFRGPQGSLLSNQIN
jgi:hypothetical protein